MKDRTGLLYLVVIVGSAFLFEAAWTASDRSTTTLAILLLVLIPAAVSALAFADKGWKRFPFFARIKLLAQRAANANTPGTGSRFFLLGLSALLVNFLCQYKWIASAASQVLEFTLALSAILVSIIGLLVLNKAGRKLLQENVLRNINLALTLVELLLGPIIWLVLLTVLLPEPAAPEFAGSLRTITLLIFILLWTMHEKAPFLNYRRIAGKNRLLHQLYERWHKKVSSLPPHQSHLRELPELARLDAETQYVLEQAKLAIAELLLTSADHVLSAAQEQALEQKLDEQIMRLRLATFVPLIQ